MTLENTFYVMAIICMTLGIIILVALVVAVFYIKKKITDLEVLFNEKMEVISRAAANPAEAAVGIGASLAEAAVGRIKSAFDSKKQKKKG